MLTPAAVFLGSTITIMIFFNGMLAKFAGDGNSLILNHIVGSVLIFGIYLIFERKKINIKSIPKLYLTSGALGVIIILMNNIVINKIGVSILVVLTIAGQLLASVIIDSFGMFGREVYKIDAKKAFSLALVALGVFLMYLS